jgi:hypothetical protein
MRDVPRCGTLSLLQKPLHHMGIQKGHCQAFVSRALTQLLPAPAFTAQQPLRGHLRSLFRYETPVFERSAPGCRIAPCHLIFMELTLLRAAARFAITLQQHALDAPTGAIACGNAAAAPTPSSSSPSPPFTACITVAAASPSPPLGPSPRRGNTFFSFSCFLRVFCLLYRNSKRTDGCF